MDCAASIPVARDVDDSNYSRWIYATSNSRSEPLESSQGRAVPSLPQTPQQSFSSPLLVVPSLVQTSRGVWEDEDGVYYSSNWPPVKDYLGRIRNERRMVQAPSEIIFVLAALDVAHCPGDIAHWIFWPSATYFNTADRVTNIALHKPRLIKTKIPWIGSREYRWTINAYQEKYYYTHILKKWYPTNYQPLEAKKRALRSNGGGEDRQEITINEFFNIIEDDGPPTKRARRAPKTADEPETSSYNKRAPRLPQQNCTLPTPSEISEPTIENAQPIVEDTDSPIVRSSGRIKRKIAPVARAPRILTSLTPPLSNLSEFPTLSLHWRNRSTSQSSDTTVVDSTANQRRSASVDSIETIVGSSLSKKRKVDDLDDLEVTDDQKRRSQSPGGVNIIVRRSMTKTARLGDITVEGVELSSPLSDGPPSPMEFRPKSSRAKTKSRKARA